MLPESHHKKAIALVEEYKKVYASLSTLETYYREIASCQEERYRQIYEDTVLPSLPAMTKSAQDYARMQREFETEVREWLL